MTKVLDFAERGAAAVLEAAEILRGGGLVAFPTETVYGLGALGLDPKAVARIFEAKRRPHSDPLILHVADPAHVTELTREVPAVAKALMEAFWPGPLTLVLPKSELVPDLVTAGLDSVAVRVPQHPAALALLRELGAPLAAPSANLFSRPSPTSAEHVLEDLRGRIDAVLDAGPTTLGIESTVVDVRGEKPKILRPGRVTAEEIERVVGAVERAGVERGACGRESVEGEGLASPGLLEKHYSPRAEVRLYEGEGAPVLAAMRRDIEALPPGTSAMVLAFSEDAPHLRSPFVTVVPVAGRSELPKFAKWLYYWFRVADQRGVEVIFVRTAPPGGLGDAINDRLRRAASGRVIRSVG